MHVETIRKRTHEVRLFGRVARKKPYLNKINREKRVKFARKCLKSQWSFRRMLFGPTSQNLIFSARMVKLWFGKQHVKNSIKNVEFLRSSTVVVQPWFGDVSPVRQLEKSMYWIVSWTDFTIEIFWNKICNHQSIILTWVSDAFSCMIMIANIP